MLKRLGRSTITLLLFVLVFADSYGHDRQAAREAYQRARRYHDRLLQKPESERMLNHYGRAIFLYRRVIDHDPTYGACDDALYATAALYEEMAERFENSRYRQRAIHYYKFLAREYPVTKHREAALERARILERGPTDPSEHTQAASARHLATVSEIRYWSNQDYTRVVIELDRETEFERHVLPQPPRLYFDLQQARLKPDLEGKTYPLDDLFIRQIRVAENRPGVVRVVLDFKEIKQHTVFALYDPYRIVVDTRGKRIRPGEEHTEVNTEEASIPLRADQDEIEVTSRPVVPSPNLGGDRSLTRVLGLKVGRVIIDPGHGGGDTGTIGPNGLKEKDLVLDVSLRLKELLETRLGTEVVLTRSTDTFVPLEERTAIANQLGADLFISVHANSSPNRRTSGIETFFLNFTSNADEREVASRENASSQKNIRELENLLKQIALGDYNEESRELAHVVQENLHLGLKEHRPALRDRGVKTAPFIVLINLNMPGILAEIGFISNPVEEKFFMLETGRDEAAEALYRGVEEYLRSLGVVPFSERTATSDRP